MKQYRSEKAGQAILQSYDQLLKQWQIPLEEADFSSPYGSTHVIIAGNPKALPLVLFHGVGDDSALMWVYNARFLAEHFRIYAVDTLGGPGKSKIGSAYAREFDDVAWIDHLLDQLDIRQCNIAGVSHGGYLAQLYTLRRPGRVRRTLCISSTVFDAPGGSPMKTMMKIFMPEALLPTAKNTVRLLNKLSGDHAHVFTENPAILSHYQALLRGFNNMAMTPHKVGCFSADEIAQIREKTLFLAGEADPFQILGGKEALLRHRMHAIWYPRAGHGLNHELAQEINLKIQQYFLDEHI